MDIIKKINNYIDDKVYKIMIIDNYINIINYQEIVDFDDKKIIVKHNKGLTTVMGDNLTIVKLLKEELLIEGSIREIKLI